jgi:site-specific DNA-cytosine methylase
VQKTGRHNSHDACPSKAKNPRRLTPRECSRLMDFPDTYRIPASGTKANVQFSQASVIPVITAVARLMAPKLIAREANLQMLLRCQIR